jgi:transposase
LQELKVSKEDPDPKALSCYGLLDPETKTIRLRFVDGRPVSPVTTAFLEWLCQQLQAQGQRVLLLIWDNASWHVSKEVRTWLRQHNQSVLTAQRQGQAGVCIIPCWLPIKSPWLNRIEPHWVHGKRAIVEPARLLTAQELEKRVCDYFGCPLVDHLTQQAA